jgi:hypothetical protein
LEIPILQHHFIDVAPTPIFARFKRPHDRVPGGMEMLGGVFIFGGITATDVSTG